MSIEISNSITNIAEGLARFGRKLALYRQSAVRPDGKTGFRQLEVGKLSRPIAEQYDNCLPVSNSHLSGVEKGINALSVPMLSTLVHLYGLNAEQLYDLVVGQTSVEELEHQPVEVKVSGKTPVKVIPSIQEVAWLASIGAQVVAERGLAFEEEAEEDQTEEVMRDGREIIRRSPDVEKVETKAGHSSNIYAFK